MHCGVIPYIEKDNKRNYILGIDSATGDLCDFGGRPYPCETLKEAAIREYLEETNSSFGVFKVDDEIIIGEVYLLFVRIYNYVPNVSNFEISGARIYNHDEIKKLIEEKKVFHLICNALKIGIE